MAKTVAKTKPGRVERLETRLTAEQKKLIARAAALQGRSVTDFVLTSVADAARRTIADHETLVLTDRDRAVFFDVLVNPPAPNARLKRAFAEHARRVAR
jgi:uncharacterized protein (DUF1778 family)